MFYDQHIRDFILTKICYARSHFFGNVTYPKEVRRCFLLSETCLEILQCTQLLISPMPKKTHFPNNTMYVSMAHNMRINIAKIVKTLVRGNLVSQVYQPWQNFKDCSAIIDERPKSQIEEKEKFKTLFSSFKRRKRNLKFFSPVPPHQILKNAYFYL